MNKYTEKVGRRKTSSARVRLMEGTEENTINGKLLKEVVTDKVYLGKLAKPFEVCGIDGGYYYTVVVKGGGLSGQIDAIVLGLSRCLSEISEENHKALRSEGLLTRDPRMVESKKVYFKKARKKSQFSKR